MDINKFTTEYIKLLKENNYKLEEMSKTLAEIKDKEIQCYEDVMIEHLCKLYFYRNLRTYDIDGWKSEIHTFIPNVSLIKTKNKFPSEEQLNNWTINQFSDVLKGRIEGQIKDFIYDGYPKLDNYNINGAYDFIIGYYSELNKILAMKGYITKGETHSILDRLLKN